MPARRLRSVAVLLAALPVLMAPGKCGFALDYSNTFLITEDIDRIVIRADDGLVLATAYEREATLFKRHVFAWEPSLYEPTHGVEDDALACEARCKYEGNCRFDFMFETPPHVAYDIEMKDTRVSLGYTTGDITVQATSGWFHGVQLRSRRVDLDYGDADVELELLEVPESVAISVATGDVLLSVPAGTYRCELTASGDTAVDGVTCDDSADALLVINADAGEISVTGVTA
jgi:hypothetical protein